MSAYRGKDSQELLRRATTVTWPPDKLGNHRVIVRVSAAADAVRVIVPWRRRDRNPERIGIRLFETASGEEITNVIPVDVAREHGDFVFQAKRASNYEIYFLPYTISGASYCPATNYLAADYSSASPAWLEKHGLKDISSCRLEDLPKAEVVEIQSRTDFDCFDPMEVIATKDEIAQLLGACVGRSYLIFPEDRCHPIRMFDELPQRWIETGPRNEFFGQAQPNEYYTFQLGVYALKQIKGIHAGTSDLRSKTGQVIPASAITCFNLEGIDWLGRDFQKEVSIEEGKVQALWFGIDIPETAAGLYRGTMTLCPENAEPSKVVVSVDVSGAFLDDRGDGDLWRHSRLRWLNSAVGIDDEPTAPYTALTVHEQTVGCLGRQVSIGRTGLPESIRSFFAPTVDRLQEEPIELLAGPVRFVAGIGGQQVSWNEGNAEITQTAPGKVVWKAESTGGPLSLLCEAEMEFDGYIDYRLVLKAKENVSLSDIHLEIPLRQEAATYMMGMGCKGGYRPGKWEYRWDIERANNMVWIGAVNAGIQCKLKHDNDIWALGNLKAHGLPDAWHNEGRGGCIISEEQNGVVLINAFSGTRALQAGNEIVFRFALLVTPLKTVDTNAHWQQRYYHSWEDPDIEEASCAGATVLNIHQGKGLIPHINYPFLYLDRLKECVNRAKRHGMKIKFYYTVRELTNYVQELWALRSLGEELFLNGPGFVLADQLDDKKAASPAEAKEKERPSGGPWLCEHLIDSYIPAWHQPFPDGQMDAAIATTGLSRWHNYYLEGLAWLICNLGIDGIYLDGIGYDRQIMKRVRKVMDREKSGCLTDFHSGNSFAYSDRRCSPANTYMEHFPYIDSLWFGEMYDYNETPDYWLVEVSGIPFGLMGEMLQGGGNPWRGMLYGMTNRLGWGGNPGRLWKLWDEFGIQDARMIGYWVPSCPIKTNHKDILATAYVKEEKTLISLASWAQEEMKCRLVIDWEALGLDSNKAKIYAPEISEFQDEWRFKIDEEIPVSPARGWLLILDKGRKAWDRS